MLTSSSRHVLNFLLTLVLTLSHTPGWTQPDTVAVKKEKRFRTLDWAIPGGFILAGIGLRMDRDLDNHAFISNYEIWEERNENFINFSHHADNYMQFTPAAIALGLSALGIPGKNDFLNQALLLAKSELLMTAIVYPLKQISGVQRPDNSTSNSFPSGHTAQAFVAAAFLSREYGSKSIWISVGAYSMATTVGAFRILNNRHWLSDVLAGAGIGLLSTQVVYATHQYRWGQSRAALSVLPYFSPGQSVGLLLQINGFSTLKDTSWLIREGPTHHL